MDDWELLNLATTSHGDIYRKGDAVRKVFHHEEIAYDAWSIYTSLRRDGFPVPEPLLRIDRNTIQMRFVEGPLARTADHSMFFYPEASELLDKLKGAGYHPVDFQAIIGRETPVIIDVASWRPKL